MSKKVSNSTRDGTGVFLHNYHVILDATKMPKNFNFVIPYSPYTFAMNAKALVGMVTNDNLIWSW